MSFTHSARLDLWKCDQCGTTGSVDVFANDLIGQRRPLRHVVSHMRRKGWQIGSTAKGPGMDLCPKCNTCKTPETTE